MVNEIGPILNKAAKRLLKYSPLIALCGGLMGYGLYLYSKQSPLVFTAKSTVFPITASSSRGGNSAISAILGSAGTDGNFSADASVNILDLVYSRKVTEAVALAKPVEFGNKTIAEVLITSYNKYKKNTEFPISIPKDIDGLKITGGGLLRGQTVAKQSKTGLLEVYFSNPDASVLTPITKSLITELSDFYIDLKTAKAKKDKDDAVRKYDSMLRVVNAIDAQAIAISRRTLFTTKDKLEYSLPIDNLSAKKSVAMSFLNNALAQREDAIVRLEKATPIIRILDEPVPPFAAAAPPTKMYGLIGLVAGILLATIVALFDIIFAFAKSQMVKKDEETDTTADEAIAGIHYSTAPKTVVTTTVSTGGDAQL